MNYSLTYQNIVSNARNRIKNAEFTEGHHIVPRSFGGTDDTDNIVFLTTKEHYICHRLLVKMHADDDVKRRKMIYALWWMSKTRHNLNGFVVTSRQYSEARKMFVESVKMDTGRADKIRQAHHDGKFDYELMGGNLKATLSKLSDAEMSERMKNSALSCDQEKRAEEIRRGKSSEFTLEKLNGEIVTFFSYDDVLELTGYDYRHIKYRLKRYGGYLTNGERVVCVRKYTGNDKNIGRKRSNDLGTKSDR